MGDWKDRVSDPLILFLRLGCRARVTHAACAIDGICLSVCLSLCLSVYLPACLPVCPCSCASRVADEDEFPGDDSHSKNWCSRWRYSGTTPAERPHLDCKHELRLCADVDSQVFAFPSVSDCMSLVLRVVAAVEEVVIARANTHGVPQVQSHSCTHCHDFAKVVYKRGYRNATAEC
jgi:hypothetical protein